MEIETVKFAPVINALKLIFTGPSSRKKPCEILDLSSFVNGLSNRISYVFQLKTGGVVFDL